MNVKPKVSGRKMASVILLLALTWSTFFVAPSQAAEALLTDITGHPNAEAIRALSTLGVIAGYPDGTFRPEQTITRAEFAALIIRCLGLAATAEAKSGASRFADVSKNHWASGAITLAADRGIVKGDPNGRFRPNDPVGGAEALTMIVRALGREAAVDSGLQWPAGHCALATQLGIISADQSDAQRNPATRAVVAEFLFSALPLEIHGAGTTFLASLGATWRIGRVTATHDASSSLPGVDIIGNISRLEAGIYTVPAAPAYLPASELVGQRVRLLLDAEGRAFSAQPVDWRTGTPDLIATVESDGAGSKTIRFAGGYSLGVSENVAITSSGLPLSDAASGWHLITPGTRVWLKVDVTTKTITAIDVPELMQGDIHWVDAFGEPYYSVNDSVRSLIKLYPGSPDGNVRPDTVLVLNGSLVDEATLRAELKVSFLLAEATVTVDPLTGAAASVEVVTADNQQCYRQPLLAVTQSLLPDGTVGAGIRTASGDVRPVLPSAGIIKDGLPCALTDLRAGDLLTFRMSGRAVSFLSALTDTSAPTIGLLLTQRSLNDYSLYVGEAIDPNSLRLSVDGVPYALYSGDLAKRPQTNNFIVVYSPQMLFGRTRTQIQIRSVEPTRDGAHRLSIEASDYAGNRLATTAEIHIDAVPPTYLSEIRADGMVVTVKFSEMMADMPMCGIANWQCFSNGEKADLIADISHQMNLNQITLVLRRPLKSGDVLEGYADDVAGNQVLILIAVP